MSPIEYTQVHIRVGSAGRTPVYATPGSAGCDLYCAEDICLWPGETKVVPLDLRMALECGVEAQIRPRSGLSLRTLLRIPNSPGTIDSDYRDPVAVILHNTFHLNEQLALWLREPGRLAAETARFRLAHWHERADQADLEALRRLGLADDKIWLDADGNPIGTLFLRSGERIAQMVFCRSLQAQFIEHESLEHIGSDRGGGFGSTGST